MYKLSVEIKNVGMAYKLYERPEDRMKEALHPFRKKYHKKFNALKDINLSVNKGEILGVIGKNGAGKSTLMKVITGVLSPTTGSVITNGMVASILELTSGFNPEYSGYDNIYFYGSILGLLKKDIDKKIDEILRFADLKDFIYRPVKNYSNGMKARLSFAINTSIDADIMIFDEVFAVGDMQFRRKCYERMEGLFDQGKTIILVSHSEHLIIQTCKRVVWLDCGKLMMDGKPKDVIDSYDYYLRNGKFLKKRNVNESKAIVIESAHQKKIIKPIRNEDAVRYGNNDAEIYCFRIMDESGTFVNKVQLGKSYVFSYKVKFNKDIEQPLFGMAFRDEKGETMTGVGGPSKKKFNPIVEKNIIIRVSYKINIQLLPGHYFITIGTSGLINKERVFLDRIVDAYCISVLGPLSDGRWGRFIVNAHEKYEIDEGSDTNDKLIDMV